MNATQELMRRHTSVRKFLPDAISDEQLQHWIQAGQQASTSSFIQATSVIRVRNPTTRCQLAELAGKQEYVASAPLLLVFCADLLRASTLAKQQLGQPLPQGYIEHLLIATVDTALFAQNVMLAAESEQYGGVFIGGIRNAPQQVAELLALPSLVYPVFAMCLGKPDQAPSLRPRLPTDLVLMEERYQPLQPEDPRLHQYDAEVRQYYRERSGGKKDMSWSEQMAQLLGKEARPHMLAFLHNQGFALR